LSGGALIYDNNPALETQVKFWGEHIKSTIDKSLECAPENRLDWTPAAGMITLGNIFLHISEASDWWINEVIKKEKSLELVSEPAAASRPKADIKKFLDNHWERLDKFFASDPRILKEDYQFQGRARQVTFSGYWIYNHLLEHDIHHRAQINQYLRILGITPPEI
jgi:uncharacterized damage-inducible protein DinB